MTYTQLAYLHLASILPAFALGTYLLVNRKGTPRHKMLGKFYLLLMLMTALTTLFMPAEIGPTLLGHFGYIHSLSLLVLALVPRTYFAARNGNIALHKQAMIGMYVGAILIAGSLAFMPGRLLHDWIFL